MEITDINSHLVKAPLGGAQPISTSVLVTALQIDLSSHLREVDRHLYLQMLPPRGFSGPCGSSVVTTRAPFIRDLPITHAIVTMYLGSNIFIHY